MTTIAYKDGVLAADTLATCNGYLEGRQTKIARVGKALVGAVGSTPMCNRFRGWVAAGMTGESPFEGKDEGNGIVVTPDGVIVVWSHLGPWAVQDRPYYALGSGEQIAVGAMAAGASAEEAVRIAMRHDTISGGDVMVLRV